MNYPAIDEVDLTLLRRCFDVARESRARGAHPFGALLAGPERTVLLEQGNEFNVAQDMTAHAELLLASTASRSFGSTLLRRCTAYVSAEPCAMCAGALYWAGVGRVVYGQSERDLKRQTGAHAENPTLALPCRVVFAAGQREVVVSGPLLEDEAAMLQSGFWGELQNE